MKTIIYSLAILLVAGRCSVLAVDGYATINGATTGGEGGPTVTVSNLAEFIKYTGTNIPYIVQLQGNLFVPTRIAVKSDKTILGLGTNSSVNGNVYLSGVSNVVMRNMFFTNPTDDNFDGPDDEDGVTVVNGANHIWIDHCTFSNCLDGEADITKASDFVTVSWCKFFYTANTNGHNFVNLIGGDDGDTNDFGKLHVTFHHNWWSTLCVERMPSVRFGRVHVYNNYYNASGNSYCLRARIEAECLVENNFYQNVKNPWIRYDTTGNPGLCYATNNNVGYLDTSYGVTWSGGGSSVLIPGNDTVFTPPYSYTLDNALDVPNLVTNFAGAGRVPVASFTGSPTAVSTPPLGVTFTDQSAGDMITDRFWDFGDGTTTNTTETSLTHTYTSLGSYDVSLTVSSLAGSNTLSRAGYIAIAKLPPTINGDLTVTNATLLVGNVAIVVAGETNLFSVGATDPDGEPLVYQWSFGDGVTNSWSPSNTVEHAYTNCGPFNVSVTISNSETSITSNFTVAVACQLNLGKIATKLSFIKTNADACTVAGSFALPTNSTFAGKHAILDVGGAQLSFTLPAKGTAINGASKFSTPKLNKKTGLWALKAGFKGGSWQSEWADYSMINSNILKPGALVSDLPVILLLDTEAFMAITNLHYTATQGKSGQAR